MIDLFSNPGQIYRLLLLLDCKWSFAIPIQTQISFAWNKILEWNWNGITKKRFNVFKKKLQTKFI